MAVLKLPSKPVRLHK